MLLNLITWQVCFKDLPGQTLSIDYPKIDYGKWRSYNIESNYDINRTLDDLLVELDCTKEYSSGRPMMTTFPIYKSRLSDYLYWLLKIEDQELYNIYLELLIIRHIDNLYFEYEHPYIKLSKSKSSKKLGWVRQITADIFTGEETYIYQNLDNGTYQRSDNPNLLDELNSKRKKKVATKNSVKVPKKTNTINEVATFNFKTNNSNNEI